MHLSSVSEREKEASDRVQNISAMKESLEKQMEQHREQHAKNLAELREEVAEKQSLIDQLKEYVFHRSA
jgi:kinesin family protein 5